MINLALDLMETDNKNGMMVVNHLVVNGIMEIF
jgi:hypothetical protein